MDEHVYFLETAGKGVWALGESPANIMSDEEMTVSDLFNPTPGRVKYLKADGSTKYINVVFSVFQGESHPYIKSSDLRQLVMG